MSTEISSDTGRHVVDHPILRERLSEVVDELNARAEKPMKFRGIDACHEYLNELEIEFTFSEEQIRAFDAQTAWVFVSYMGAWHSERIRLRGYYREPGVISGAWEEARAAYRRVFPGRPPCDERVLCVLAGEPDWDVTDVLLPEVTVKPHEESFARRRWRYSLLECPEWFYLLLGERIRNAPPKNGEFPLSAPVKGYSDEAREIAVSLWEDAPGSEFFGLEEAFAAARGLL